jgi:hypothetical protein
LIDLVCISRIKRQFKRDLKHIIIAYAQGNLSERHRETIHANLLPYFSHDTGERVLYGGRISWKDITMALWQRPFTRLASHKTILITNSAFNDSAIDLCLTGLRALNGESAERIVVGAIRYNLVAPLTLFLRHVCPILRLM